MRRTGRTTRIVNHVIEQLFNAGTCIATDHFVYEQIIIDSNISSNSLIHFIKQVEYRIKNETENTKVEWKIIRIENVPYVKFNLKYETKYKTLS